MSKFFFKNKISHTHSSPVSPFPRNLPVASYLNKRVAHQRCVVFLRPLNHSQTPNFVAVIVNKVGRVTLREIENHRWKHTAAFRCVDQPRHFVRWRDGVGQASKLQRWLNRRECDKVHSGFQPSWGKISDLEISLKISQELKGRDRRTNLLSMNIVFRRFIRLTTQFQISAWTEGEKKIAKDNLHLVVWWFWTLSRHYLCCWLLEDGSVRWL